jgi:PKD repeat protein
MNRKTRKNGSLMLILMTLITVILLTVPVTMVSANEPPIANAEPKYQEIYEGEEAWFSANGSYDPDGYIVYYEWDFGDGSYGYGVETSHIYNTPGNYTVWLTVYDNENGSARDYVMVVVHSMGNTNSPPTAVAYPDYQVVAAGEDAWFYGGLSSDSDGYIVSYEWNFGDGNIGYGINITHKYTAPGFYNVSLTVTDNEGATDTDYCVVEVTGTSGKYPPVSIPNPESQTVNVGEPAFLYGGSSYDPDGYIVSYEWDFGDGNFGSGENVSHAYTTPGEYTVSLTVTDNDNMTDSEICQVIVEENIPAPPTDLDANLVTGALEDVKLTFSASQDDGAGDNNVAGYTVYRSSSGINGAYVFAAWIPAAGIPAYTYEWVDSGAGDGDLNNYFYIVRANDSFGNEEQNDIKVGKFVSHLDEGWNMISVPLVQKDTKREVVLQTIEGNYVTVQGYHAGKSRPWLHWHRNKPNKFNDVIAIDHKNGYYVDMQVADYLVTAGKVATSTDISLKTGWNLVGFPSLTDLLRDDALSSISGKYNKVERYDTTLDKEVRLDSGDYMQPGLGYWIHTTENCVLTITN